MYMSVRKLILVSFVFSLTLLAGTLPLRAQDEPQPPVEGKPKPAGASTPIPITNPGDIQNAVEDVTNNLTPDITPLTGALTPTLGSPETLHSYWVPGIQWSGSIQSNGYSQTQNSGWLMNNFILGNLSVLQVWRRSQLAVNYSAGGFISSDSSQGNGYSQQLAISQTFHWNRWLLQLNDQFSYLPQTSLGFGSGTGLGNPGVGGPVGPVIPGIGNSYVPNQGIYSAVGPRYSNSAVVQLTYTTSPRGSITMSGSYGLLDFVNSGNIDSDFTTGTIGYNYTFTRQDSLGVFYRFSAYHYSGEPQANGDHSFNFAYSRKLTGRLALQIYAGPDFITSRISTNGNSLAYGVNVGASLSYGAKNGGLSGAYSHGISNGSGVLAGSTADQLNFGANHKLNRIWSAQFNLGFAHNAALNTGIQTTSQSFNTWTVGGGLSRPAGRNGTLAVAYNADLTDYGQAGCVGTACSSNQVYNYVTINFQWHTRPLILP
jgi:hypothetical protein